ncbi:MAG TPA: DUF1326 domain-containing protein [Dehalococcoidia bacterium]
MTTVTKPVYQLEGTLLEACSCGVLCPCWIGENADGGECFAFNAYHFDSGQVGGCDVSGLNLVNIVHIPGNVLAPKSWKVAMFVDDIASEDQKKAIVGVFKGDYGGPLADLAGLIGEVLGIESARIDHQIIGGKGHITIGGGVLDAELTPYRGPDGTITTLRDSLFSTVPGSPAYVAKATKHRVNLPKYGMKWEFENRNAIQSDYSIEYSA